MNPRVLALDYGEKRIGVAISDPLWITAQPLPFIPHDEKFLAAITKVVADYDATELLIGLPKDLKGNDSLKATEVRAFGKNLGEKLALPVSYWDERYSTAAAQKHLITMDIRRDKRKLVIDSMAAAFFLQGYMELKRNKS